MLLLQRLALQLPPDSLGDGLRQFGMVLSLQEDVFQRLCACVSDPCLGVKLRALEALSRELSLLDYLHVSCVAAHLQLVSVQCLHACGTNIAVYALSGGQLSASSGSVLRGDQTDAHTHAFSCLSSNFALMLDYQLCDKVMRCWCGLSQPQILNSKP